MGQIKNIKLHIVTDIQVLTFIAVLALVTTAIEGYATEDNGRRVKFAVNAVNAVKAKNSINAKFAETASDAMKAENAGVAKFAKNSINAKNVENAEQAVNAENVKWAKYAKYAKYAYIAKNASVVSPTYPPGAKNRWHKKNYIEELKKAKEEDTAFDKAQEFMEGHDKDEEAADEWKEAPELEKGRKHHRNAINAMKAINAVRSKEARHSINAYAAKNAGRAEEAKNALWAEYAKNARCAKNAKNAKKAKFAKNAEWAMFAAYAKYAKKLASTKPPVVTTDSSATTTMAPDTSGVKSNFFKALKELRRKFGKMGMEKIKGETGKWQFTPRIGGLQDN